MLVVNLDDYDIILGIDFLRETKIVLMPYLNEAMITSERCLCLILCCNVIMTSATQKGKSLVLGITIGKALCKGD